MIPAAGVRWCVTLPAGDVRAIRPDARLMAELRPLVSAAADEGEPVGLPGGYRLRCADLPGPLLLASITAAENGAEVCFLTVADGPGAARTWAHLRAAQPDRLPDRLPARWCAVIPTAGALLPTVAAIACCWAGGLRL